MSDLFIYLIKVSAGLGIVFLPYYFLFRNDPNLHIKRFYLISGIIASWAFPFITFRKLPLAVDLTPTVFIDLDTPVVQAVTLESTGAGTAFSINWLQLFVIIYMAGLGLMLLKNLFVLSKWNLTWRRTRNEEGVAFINNNQVFTLFKKIFVPDTLKNGDDLENVLLHERAHIRQFHYVDLLFMEFTLLFTWFNPFSWLISRMIKENHEHLADREVLSTGINPARYRAQLMNHTLGVNVFRLGTQFNHSLTLKRFKMMKKPKKSPWGMLKIALLIPAVLVTLGLTIGMTPQQKTIKGKVVLADSGEPVPGASIVIRNGTTGCVSDLEGNFMLNVDGNPELVISFVGMETLVVKATEVGKKPLELKVKTYSLDLESAPDEEVFYVVEDMPTFNGGDPGPEFRKYIAQNLRYPESAAMKGVDGRVIVQFMVNTEGKVTNAIVVRSADTDLDKEALRVVNSSPEWTPGKQRGKKVNVLFTFPINFVLDEEYKSKIISSKADKLTIKTDGARAEPIYVLDGKVVDSVEDLDPESIERVDVIKDPDNPQAKKYNAKDGVVIVTSKEAAQMEKTPGMEKDGEVFYIVEDMPKFPGGKPAMKAFIYSNLEYPEKAKNQGIEGEVMVRFLVNQKGRVEQTEVVRSTYEEFNAPALKVINAMPDWTPGKQRGKAVKVWFVVPIKFNDERK